VEAGGVTMLLNSSYFLLCSFSKFTCAKLDK
jgi:hypothetical protein